MKDEHSTLFRVLFVLALAFALCAYAYFLYPPLRAQFSGNYHARIALEKEKDAIAEIMLDPGLISERITDMQGQLLETRPIKGLTPAGVVDDITRCIDRFGLELQSVTLGVPEAPGGAIADEPQLLSMPVVVQMRAPYDGGMYFIGSLEKSETGTYKIGEFSFKPARPADADGAAGDETADADGADGDETADTDAGDGKDAAANAGSAGGKEAAEGTGESEAAAAGEADPYPIFEWAITVYLLYYG
ncbi:MAG: hypothetical protein LBP73_03090 [Clostridiales Family XIII bacterium]|jgi:hypothetical protein|nr:hypothetical protein [Clostridiales Family XIII bacterium]